MQLNAALLRLPFQTDRSLACFQIGNEQSAHLEELFFNFFKRPAIVKEEEKSIFVNESTVVEAKSFSDMRDFSTTTKSDTHL